VTHAQETGTRNLYQKLALNRDQKLAPNRTLLYSVQVSCTGVWLGLGGASLLQSGGR